MGLLNAAASWLKGTIDGWLDTIESLDPSKNLKGVGKVAGTLNKFNPLHHLTKTHDGEKYQDLRPSEVFEDVLVDAIQTGRARRHGRGRGHLCGRLDVGRRRAMPSAPRTVMPWLSWMAAWELPQSRTTPRCRPGRQMSAGAFRFRIVDPAATLYVAIFDDDPNPLQSDDPIGRCAVGLRSLAPNAAYDAWFPLVFAATEGEALANAGRALVADEPLATAATNAAGKHTQKDSRGAVRLRVKVTWDDGGTTMAKSALTDLLGEAKPQCVTFPATKGGRGHVRLSSRSTSRSPLGACRTTSTSWWMSERERQVDGRW